MAKIITEIIEKKELEFGKLEKGEYFEWDNKLYCKTGNCLDNDDCSVNAFGIKEGELLEFDNFETVRRVTKINITCEVE